MTTRYTAKTKKTTFALIIAAVLAAALLFFAAWAPSGIVVEGAEGDSGAATQDTQYTHELSVSEADFTGGYADEKPSEKRFELNTTATSGEVTAVTNGAVTAEAFPQEKDETGSTIPYRSVGISLQGKLLSHYVITCLTSQKKYFLKVAKDSDGALICDNYLKKIRIEDGRQGECLEERESNTQNLIQFGIRLF